MYFILLIIAPIILIMLLGHLSYRINVLNKGAREFLPSLPKELFKIIIYISIIILLIFCRKDNFYHILTNLLSTYLLVFDLNKEIQKKYSDIIQSIPPILIKTTLMLISVVVIVEINEYTTTTVGLGISNLAIVLTSITFLFTLAYFGSIMLLFIIFIIEIELLLFLFKIEKASSNMIISLYNLLSDNNHIKINTYKNHKLKKHIKLLIIALQLTLAFQILQSTNFIDDYKKGLERIVIYIAYSEIYPGCDNIPAQPLYKMMFIDFNNVSLATPVWKNSYTTEKIEENIEKYSFSRTTCRKNN